MKDIRIDIATVIFYDGVEAYTTHRALFVDYTDKMKLTPKSKKALKYDFDCAGCEVLKVDLNCQSFSDVNEFMEKIDINSIYKGTEKDIEYIKEKFLEYFIEK